jgi:hypothetical protein
MTTAQTKNIIDTIARGAEAFEPQFALPIEAADKLLDGILDLCTGQPPLVDRAEWLRQLTTPALTQSGDDVINSAATGS